MIQKSSKEKQEQQAARLERQEFQAELAGSQPQANPHYRRRVVTFTILGIVAVLALAFTWLVFLPSSTQNPGTGVAVGNAAPEFKLPIYGGGGAGFVDLHALRGHPVVVNFWSESCGPCRAEIPDLQRIYARYGQGEFAMVGINQADPKDDIASFSKSFRVTYPLLFDKGESINATYGVTAIPTTFFIDSDGIVRAVYVTQLTPDTMRQGLASVGILIP